MMQHQHPVFTEECPDSLKGVTMSGGTFNSVRVKVAQVHGKNIKSHVWSPKDSKTVYQPVVIIHHIFAGHDNYNSCCCGQRPMDSRDQPLADTNHVCFAPFGEESPQTRFKTKEESWKHNNTAGQSRQQHFYQWDEEVKG